MARRDPVGIRLLTRNGNDWSALFPLVVEAVNHLNVRSCLIDGEVVCCYERGLVIFSTLRRRRNEAPYKHGLYSAKAIARRRSISMLIRSARPQCS